MEGFCALERRINISFAEAGASSWSQAIGQIQYLAVGEEVQKTHHPSGEKSAPVQLIRWRRGFSAAVRGSPCLTAPAGRRSPAHSPV